jgi:membrane protein DedA with SNARE-associated domain
MRMKYRTLLWFFIFALSAMLVGRVLDPRPADTTLTYLWAAAIVSLSLGIAFILIRNARSHL